MSKVGQNTTLKIVVNGEERSVYTGDVVTDLLRALGLENGRVAIERNLKILPRTEWAATKIESNDRYEIVQFVGGG